MNLNDASAALTQAVGTVSDSAAHAALDEMIHAAQDASSTGERGSSPADEIQLESFFVALPGFVALSAEGVTAQQAVPELNAAIRAIR